MSESSTPETAAAPSEYIATCFHSHYERLAPEFGYATRPESAVPFSEVPEPNRSLMVTVAGHVMRDILDWYTARGFTVVSGGEGLQHAAAQAVCEAAAREDWNAAMQALDAWRLASGAAPGTTRAETSAEYAAAEVNTIASAAPGTTAEPGQHDPIGMDLHGHLLYSDEPDVAERLEMAFAAVHSEACDAERPDYRQRPWTLLSSYDVHLMARAVAAAAGATATETTPAACVKAQDSARWCDVCQAWGLHHTDRHDAHAAGSGVAETTP